jgi:hypothetical protein
MNKDDVRNIIDHVFYTDDYMEQKTAINYL